MVGLLKIIVYKWNTVVRKLNLIIVLTNQQVINEKVIAISVVPNL